jgi:SH3 domain protein
MKKIFWISLCLIISVSGSRAESLYVNDIVKITLRTGPGIDHKIVNMLKSGDKVEIIETGKEWSQVKSAAGDTGWALTRLLTPREPNSQILMTLEKKYQTLLQERDTPTEKLHELTEENQQLKVALAEKENTLARLSETHATMEKETAELSKIKSALKQANTQLSRQRQQLTQYEAQISNEGLSQNIKWFLSGAGVLLTGFLIGLASRKSRRRPSLL